MTLDTTSGDDELSIFDLCETDTSAEEEGRWFEKIFGEGTSVGVKLCSFTSKNSMKIRRRLERGYKKYLKNGEYPEEITQKMLIEHLAEAVLIDWKNIKDRDKADILYSKEAAVMLLTKLTHFRNYVLVASQQLDNFRVQDREEALKN